MAAFNSVLVLFLFCMAVQLMNPAPAAASKCPKSFDCGSLRSLEFPLSESPECGLFLVNCTASPPSLQLGAQAKHSFELRGVDLTTNTFHVVDTEYQKLLERQSCLSFLNRTPDDSPFASFDVRPFVTVLGCNKPLQEHAIQDYFQDYRSYNRCPHFNIYYGSSPNKESRIPDYCYKLHLPTRPNYNFSDSLFEQLLSSEFDVLWNVSTDCLSCHHRGGQCLADSSSQFQCKGGAKSKRNTAALATGISLGAVLLIGLCFAVFYIYRRRKRATNTYLHSRNISLLPSVKSDIDGTQFFLGIPIFSYEELEEATNNFDPSKELGDGGFGTVYYGQLRDGREVAIKRLYEHNCRRMEQFINEINILTCLRHPNLVSLYGCTSRRSRELLLVYEYIPNGTVANHLYGDRAHEAALTWPIRMNIAVETASALAYLHRSEIMHRDVKTTNILLDNNFSVKVADFGLSKLFPTDVTHVTTAPQGTPGYVDPEYHQCYQLTNKSDVYSFGVVLIELISSMPAVDITRHRHEINLANLALDRIQRCAFDELIDLSLGYKTDAEVERMTTSVAELAFRCLQFDGEMRPSMVEVLDFLKDLQAGGASNVGSTKVGDGNCSISPETDGVVLLKKSTEYSSLSVAGK